MKLSELARLIEARPPASGVGEVQVTGVASDSRRVRRGDVFAALRGERFDGTRFAPQAVRAGAVAVLAEGDVPGCGAPVLVVRSARDAVAAACDAVWGGRLAGLRLVGVTGTNGKTTTAHLYAHLIERELGPCGVVGTVGHSVGGETVEAQNTTPDCADLYSFLARAYESGARHAVMEVSSHALVQGRTGRLCFAEAIFTNLTGDHLDFHKTMEAYLDAKALLFEPLDAGACAVLNADDPASAELERRTRARVVTYGIDRPADFRAHSVEASTERTAFVMETPSGRATVETELLGRHNVQNILAASAAAVTSGVSAGSLGGSLAGFRGVPGRLERVEAGQGFRVLVDFAHTEGALRSVLTAIRSLGPKRVLTVFGCGGDRDRTKRPKMGRAVEDLSDLVFVTSDNPRTEDPRAIIDEILPGLRHPDKAIVEPDRRRAIALAVEAASGPGDVVLIAGKGHETYQIIGAEKAPFDDRVVAREAIGGCPGSGARR